MPETWQFRARKLLPTETLTTLYSNSKLLESSTPLNFFAFKLALWPSLPPHQIKYIKLLQLSKTLTTLYSNTKLLESSTPLNFIFYKTLTTLYSNTKF